MNIIFSLSIHYNYLYPTLSIFPPLSISSENDRIRKKTVIFKKLEMKTKYVAEMNGDERFGRDDMKA